MTHAWNRLLAIALFLAAFVALSAARADSDEGPLSTLPPGAFSPDTGPSDVIFPAQSLTIRFDHKKHVKELGRTCTSCHPGGATSNSVADKLTPPGTACDGDGCHKTDHRDLTSVKPGDGASGQCGYCHEGYKNGDGNVVARLSIPRANMVFSHAKHSARNINCQQCHGAVQELGLATRDQMPRMRGCFGCHQKSDAASRGDARGACDTCHVKGSGSEAGLIKTMFAAGVLKPPSWLHDSEHGPDFLERHKRAAGADSQFCGSCHQEDFCTDCHDGRVRVRAIHPSDYLNLHPIEARLETTRCTSCHREQSFCVPCHERIGVAQSGPPAAKSNARFHPPASVWSDPPKRPGHHAFEAERNLNACVSCHVERDCVACHGAKGVGAGFSPHSSGFLSSCAMQMKRNPRPCFVCHDPRDGELAQCK